MRLKFGPATLLATLSLAASLAQGAPRGGKEGGESHRGSPPGGEWSERTHQGKPAPQHSENSREQAGRQPSGSSQATGKEGAAAGAAAENRNSPKASGAQGAAAGAAAENRNSPKATGAQGAAAGAAAENRNSPKATGAQGAAAGAAVENRNSPKASGAQGAAAGAAVANRNAPAATGAEGAVAGAAVANRNAPLATGAGGAAAGYEAVRNSFDHPNVYSQQWYGAHPGAWMPVGWTAAGAAWAPATWGAVAGFAGYGSAAPISYDYGTNVVAQNGNVLVNGQNVGTTQEFSQQAADLALTGTEATPSDDDQWMPLGVFAMVRNETQHPQLIMQFAIDKQGLLRGNYTDELTDSTLPIHGAVDAQTQRAAWTVGDNQHTVMEAGLTDLADGAAPALIHKNGKSSHWLLIRLDQPQQTGDQGPTSN